MRSILTLALFSLGLSAQTSSPRPFVRASGQASVFVQPDQVKIDATVTAQGNTAQDAAAQNATQVAAVVAALQKLLGANADIKTINYYLSPVYKSQPSGPSIIVGYSASLTVEVTLSAISMAGAVIDTAAATGATSIGALQFSLKDPEPSRLQALKLAAARAKTHADAMAGGLNHTTGAVLTIEESSAASPIPILTAGAGGGASSAPTQITPGLIEVQANVVVQVELN